MLDRHKLEAQRHWNGPLQDSEDPSKPSSGRLQQQSSLSGIFENPRIYQNFEALDKFLAGTSNWNQHDPSVFGCYQDSTDHAPPISTDIADVGLIPSLLETISQTQTPCNWPPLLPQYPEVATAPDISTNAQASHQSPVDLENLPFIPTTINYLNCNQTDNSVFETPDCDGDHTANDLHQNPPPQAALLAPSHSISYDISRVQVSRTEEWPGGLDVLQDGLVSSYHPGNSCANLEFSSTFPGNWMELPISALCPQIWDQAPIPTVIGGIRHYRQPSEPNRDSYQPHLPNEFSPLRDLILLPMQIYDSTVDPCSNQLEAPPHINRNLFYNTTSTAHHVVATEVSNVNSHNSPTSRFRVVPSGIGPRISELDDLEEAFLKAVSDNPRSSTIGKSTGANSQTKISKRKTKRQSNSRKHESLTASASTNAALGILDQPERCFRCKVKRLKCVTRDDNPHCCQKCIEFFAKHRVSPEHRPNQLRSACGNSDPHNGLCFRKSLARVWTYFNHREILSAMPNLFETLVQNKDLITGRVRILRNGSAVDGCLSSNLKTSKEAAFIFTVMRPPKSAGPALQKYRPALRGLRSGVEMDHLEKLIKLYNQLASMLDSAEHFHRAFESFQRVAIFLDDLVKERDITNDGLMIYILNLIFRLVNRWNSILQMIAQIAEDASYNEWANKLRDFVDMVVKALKAIWIALFGEDYLDAFNPYFVECRHCGTVILLKPDHSRTLQEVVNPLLSPCPNQECGRVQYQTVAKMPGPKHMRIQYVWAGFVEPSAGDAGPGV